MSVMKVTAKNFEDEVLRSEKPVLLDFWASWCGPCRMVAPVVDEIAAEHPELKVCKINVDEEQTLASKFQIMTIPTLAVFRNGKLEDRIVGAHSKDEILALL